VTGAIAAVAALRGRRGLAGLALTSWAAGTAEFAVRRIAPGPRTAGEVVRMLWTSVVIPPIATAHWIRGWLTLRARLREQGPRPLPAAVLLDRDGTIVRNVPYNGDPELVQPVAGARTAIDRLRNRGLATAVVSNQSGVGRGLLSEEQVAAVNRRIEEVLGPLGPWVICTHSPAEGCGCRKPAPGLILEATRRLGVPPSRCVVIGDTAADVEAAEAVGARGILVPNEATRGDEVRAAREVARDLEQAVDLIVGGTP
jgi:histidinol-phosphate phosphatase family protein